MALPNVYYLTDDNTAANPLTVGGPGSGGSGSSAMLSPEFVAPTAAAALQVAYIISSALQRPVRLVPKFGGPGPYTLVSGIGPGNGLTSVPSGITY